MMKLLEFMAEDTEHFGIVIVLIMVSGFSISLIVSAFKEKEEK